jgi:aminoglycoside 6'-N-acetyltransferase I
MDCMATFTVRQAQHSDRDELAGTRTLLWPDTSLEGHLRELDGTLNKRMGGTLPVTILVSQDDRGALAGFLEVGLRSHARTSLPQSRPVWQDRNRQHEAFRNRGIGKALMRAAEGWARAQGCLEMASNTLMDNDASQLAHEALGFEVVDRCVHFRKKL